jgi:predicted Zn-dependent peptidase
MITAKSMTQPEIPRMAWVNVLDSFSKDHEGARATLEMVGPAGNEQVIAHMQIFRGVSADEKDGENQIAIFLENAAGEHTTNAVTAPDHLWTVQAEGKSGATLVIGTADGATTVLRLDTAV